MGNLRVYPAMLRGTIAAPPSKSAAHRALICAALSFGTSRISPLAHSQDITATTQVLRAMGAQIIRHADAATVTGGPCVARPVTLDCMESGSTLRFLLPIAAALGLQAAFTGSGRLPERPLAALIEQLRAHGITFSSERLPFSIDGKLSPGLFQLHGNISSQFISGLLFALPLLENDSEIVLTSPLESMGYVAMTIEALRQSGIVITPTDRGWKIPGKQTYHALDRQIEGDYSNAAFWLAAGAINGNVEISGLLPDSAQGDRAIVPIIHQFGGNILQKDNQISSQKNSLHACNIDAAQIPDLVPILAVIAAFTQGETKIYNAARLRAKESDRLCATAALLKNLGGTVSEYPDGLSVQGNGLYGGEVDGFQDHRIVMAGAVAALGCRTPVVIHGTNAVDKSYPNFFEDLVKLGGRFDVV